MDQKPRNSQVPMPRWDEPARTPQRLVGVQCEPGCCVVFLASASVEQVFSASLPPPPPPPFLMLIRGTIVKKTLKLTFLVLLYQLY